MKLNKITKKDVQDAIKALTDKGASCWFKELASTKSTGIYTRLGRGKYTTLYFVVGWSNQVGYEKEDVDYYNEATGSALVAKIAYQHSNNIMQSDIDFDFNMPYDTESMDVWDTEMAVPMGGFDDTDIAWYNKEAQDIWDIYGETGKLDLMESKQHKESCTKKEGLPPKKLGSSKQYRSRADLVRKMKELGATEITTPAEYNAISKEQRLHTAGFAMDINGNLVAQSYYGDKDGKWYYASTKTYDGAYLPESYIKKEGCKSSMQKKKESLGIDANAILNMLLSDFPESEVVSVPEKDNSLAYAFEIDGFLVWVRKDGKKVATQNETDDPIESDFVTSYMQYVTDEHEHQMEACKNKKSSMQKKKESLKKTEAFTDTIKVSTEDIIVEITECNTYDSDGRRFSVDIPSIGMKYSLEEFKDMVQGMAEDCSGTVDYSRDGSEVVVEVNAPAEDFNSVDDYYRVAYIRGIVGIVSTSIEGVVNYLYE